MLLYEFRRLDEESRHMTMCPIKLHAWELPLGNFDTPKYIPNMACRGALALAPG